ncbi:hypothetical protein PMI14_05840 [Acidovorax sp. CF316]|uniref:hypothetical protein n=1 Tax=Acidovorax sp. CF316 TaxID=1144317 RepID=UPI00026BC800|nr:hypothetical protein [Acidovorax sp. CF316]EJE49597.1 hypothetical protein PMI14_05840 [Acidovorax sp. CF316]
MIARLRTYNALRVTTGPCSAYRMAALHERATTRQPAAPAPITMDGPHPSRSTLRLQAWLRFARWVAIALAATWCLSAAAGVVYALAYY